ncbi:hypothetical protein ACLK19_13390 [Escherichia coli]
MRTIDRIAVRYSPSLMCVVGRVVYMAGCIGRHCYGRPAGSEALKKLTCAISQTLEARPVLDG